MGISQRNQQCADCKKAKSYDVATPKWGWLPGIFVAILPKCPLCFLAFSSTLAVCTEGGYQFSSHAVSSGLTVGLAAFFCGLTLLFIALNFRPDRTPSALVLAGSGSIAILLSTALAGGALLYYAGTVAMLAGVWLNGSLLYFLRKWNGSKPVAANNA